MFSADKILPKAYFILFPLLIIIPNWTVIDIKGMLWLYISILNTPFICYILIFKHNQNFNFLKDRAFISFLIFFISCLLSVFVAINKAESLMRITDFYCILSSLFIICYFINNRLIKPIVLIKIVLFTFVLDLLGSYFQLYQVYEFNDIFKTENGADIKSFYPNKNITSFIYITKIIIISLIPIYSKNRITKILAGVIIFSAFYIIFLMSTRAVLLMIPFILTLLIIIPVLKKFFFRHSLSKGFKDFSYFLVPLVTAFIVFNLTTSDESDIMVDERVTSVLSTGDESVNNRLRFYSHAFTQIKLTPLLGIGVGNWRIKSIEYDKDNMFSYVVPYSVHNDFLEVFAETGIMGIIPFTLFFYFIFINILRGSINYIRNNKNLSSIFLLIGFSMIFLDFNLNFPLDRPTSIMTYILFISVVNSIESNKQ